MANQPSKIEELLSLTFGENKTPSEQYNLPVIGTIETKELQMNSTDKDGKQEHVTIPAEKYEVIKELKDAYVCNQWYKNNVPQLVSKSMVKHFNKIGE